MGPLQFGKGSRGIPALRGLRKRPLFPPEARAPHPAAIATKLSSLFINSQEEEPNFRIKVGEL